MYEPIATVDRFRGQGHVRRGPGQWSLTLVEQITLVMRQKLDFIGSHECPGQGRSVFQMWLWLVRQSTFVLSLSSTVPPSVPPNHR